MANADCIVIQGSNMAECHPVGFQWVSEAKARGARIIHVDPRFTRTSAKADIYAPIRSGADIAFFGGMVGNIYMQFSVTMCVALCLSAINSLTLSPALCVLLLKRKQKRFQKLSRI